MIYGLSVLMFKGKNQFQPDLTKTNNNCKHKPVASFRWFNGSAKKKSLSKKQTNKQTKTQ
jgi:hypothetical protein